MITHDDFVNYMRLEPIIKNAIIDIAYEIARIRKDGSFLNWFERNDFREMEISIIDSEGHCGIHASFERYSHGESDYAGFDFPAKYLWTLDWQTQYKIDYDLEAEQKRQAAKRAKAIETKSQKLCDARLLKELITKHEAIADLDAYCQKLIDEGAVDGPRRAVFR